MAKLKSQQSAYIKIV